MTARMRRGAGCLVAMLLLAAPLATAPAASAQSTFDDEPVPFGGVNGETATVRAVGDQLWVGGQFDTAFDLDHTTSFPRANLAVFDFNTGNVHPFSADTNDKVKAIETDGASTVWVAGNFTEIRGQSVTYIAAFDLFTTSIKPGFTVVVDYPINALHYDNGWLYLGGEFGQVNGLFYNKLARVNAVTGAVDTSFRANPNATVRSIDAYGDRVYAAGLFDVVGKPPNDVSRLWVAGFDADTGVPAGPDFPFLPLQPGEGAHKAGLWRVHVSPDGNYLYTGDHRNFIVKWNRLTGAKLWSLEAEGDIQAIAAHESSVFLGTHDGFLAKGDQRLLFALAASDGATDTSFVPLLNSFIGILELEVSQGALIGVGDFTEVDGQATPHIAVFHSPDWTGAQAIDAPATPGDVNCDANVSVADALLIAQFSVGVRTESPSCPLGSPGSEVYVGSADGNGDNVVNVADALLVARCAVGINNPLCP